jgi:hypothetical protein
VKPPHIKSSYAIIDIEGGRKALARYLSQNPGLSVVIHATLTEPYGRDDGVSIEFNADVHSIEVSR